MPGKAVVKKLVVYSSEELTAVGTEK